VIDVFLAYDCDGDPYDRLHDVAAHCTIRGHHGIADDITLGALLGLSPADQRKIATARELYVFDCVLPNGWAITTRPWYDPEDEATHWTYSTGDHAVVTFGAEGAS
jgi:hypothetical protein